MSDHLEQTDNGISKQLNGKMLVNILVEVELKAIFDKFTTQEIVDLCNIHYPERMI